MERSTVAWRKLYRRGGQCGHIHGLGTGAESQQGQCGDSPALVGALGLELGRRHDEMAGQRPPWLLLSPTHSHTHTRYADGTKPCLARESFSPWDKSGRALQSTRWSFQFPWKTRLRDSLPRALRFPKVVPDTLLVFAVCLSFHNRNGEATVRARVKYLIGPYCHSRIILHPSLLGPTAVYI